MKKNILITIILLICTLLFGYGVYYKYQSAYPKSTGATIEPPPQEEIELGESIKKMKDNLPIINEKFLIKSYNYSKGKFEVDMNVNLNDANEFKEWIKNTDYSKIPMNMFEFKFENNGN